MLLGQAPTLPHYVLTATAGGAGCEVVEVDPVIGTSTPIGPFPSDLLAPLAMTQDPYNGDLLVALDLGGTASSIIRLHRFFGTYVEYPMGSVPGRVVDLTVLDDTLLVAADASNGGLYTMPRRGGSSSLIHTQPNLTAMNPIGPSYGAVVLAWTGRAGTPALDSGVAVYDYTQGTFWFGQSYFPNPNNREITGVLDLPTAIPRQLLAFDDGTMGLFVLGALAPQPVPSPMVLPPGATTALHPRGPYSAEGVVLGNAAHPYLFVVDPWSGSTLGLAVALPGDPVDFAYGIERAAHSLLRGQPCGSHLLLQNYTSTAQLGGTLEATLDATPALPVLFVASLEDFGGGLLPAALPLGCSLEVMPDVVTLEFVPTSGTATKAIPVPNSPALFGTVVHTQWAHYATTGISVSRAMANWIGN